MFPVLVGLLHKPYSWKLCFLQRKFFACEDCRAALWNGRRRLHWSLLRRQEGRGSQKHPPAFLVGTFQTKSCFMCSFCFHVFFPPWSYTDMLEEIFEQILVIKFDMATSNHQHNQACKVLQAGECWAHLMPVGDTGRGNSDRFSLFLHFSVHGLQCFQLTHWWVFSWFFHIFFDWMSYRCNKMMRWFSRKMLPNFRA